MSEQKRDWTGFCWADDKGEYSVADPIVKTADGEVAGWLYMHSRDGKVIGGGVIGATNLESIERAELEIKPDDFANEMHSDSADELLKEAFKRIFDYASTTGKNRDKELAFIKWYLEAQQAQLAGLTERLEKEREDWMDVQRRVQDANDALRWREADVKRLREAAQKVLDDCQAVGVEPFGAAALREEIAETEKANRTG